MGAPTLCRGGVSGGKGQEHVEWTPRRTPLPCPQPEEHEGPTRVPSGVLRQERWVPRGVSDVSPTGLDSCKPLKQGGSPKIWGGTYVDFSHSHPRPTHPPPPLPKMETFTPNMVTDTRSRLTHHPHSSAAHAQATADITPRSAATDGHVQQWSLPRLI